MEIWVDGLEFQRYNRKFDDFSESFTPKTSTISVFVSAYQTDISCSNCKYELDFDEY